ncbi:hypothetical protein BDI4_1020004 [Burkholderia diffusa]|nr:hypothetical protein BDI4_1020004 [Burkholderia diffusa]
MGLARPARHFAAAQAAKPSSNYLSVIDILQNTITTIISIKIGMIFRSIQHHATTKHLLI